MLVSDGEREGDERQTYPITMGPGRPVGWAYAHDTLSLGALHVAEPYRRFKDKALGDGPRSSIGRICVGRMGPKLVDAQRKALHHLKLDEAQLPCPYFADTEMDKGAARSFFEKLGFRGVRVATWGAISMPDDEAAA